MPTGTEIYNAIRQAIRANGNRNTILVNTVESCDLRKLRQSDLKALGYDSKIAESVSDALMIGNYGPLADTLGLKQLAISHDAPLLLPPPEIPNGSIVDLDEQQAE